MTFLDIIILILILLGGNNGYKKGLVSQLFVSMIFIIFFYKGIYIMILINKIFNEFYSSIKEYKYFLMFAPLLISFIFIIFSVFILENIIQFFIKITFMKPIDRLGGFIFGIIKYFLYISIYIFFLKKINKEIKIIPNYFFNSFLEKKLIYFLDRDGSLFKIIINKFREIYFIIDMLIE
ncbi:CvpA family protein [Blattabacterium cuenoti]|uniref:CvpA family protein n=1 Tax=Blattabacterium cuenoti TaxID=1653831 RepID=UPI00163D31CC|nr:CvpA family protein [Blattabacterium cuenoti]